MFCDALYIFHLSQELPHLSQPSQMHTCCQGYMKTAVTLESRLVVFVKLAVLASGVSQQARCVVFTKSNESPQHAEL